MEEDKRISPQNLKVSIKLQHCSHSKIKTQDKRNYNCWVKHLNSFINKLIDFNSKHKIVIQHNASEDTPLTVLFA